MDSLIPVSKISNLSQGIFVGAVSGNFDERIEQMIFHAEIVVDSDKIKNEMKNYVKIPNIVIFGNMSGSYSTKHDIVENFSHIKMKLRK